MNAHNVKQNILKKAEVRFVRVNPFLESVSHFREMASQKTLGIEVKANETLSSINFVPLPCALDLDIVIAAPVDFNFKENATYSNLCNWAIKANLRLVPHNLVLELCLGRSRWLQKGRRVIFAMDPVIDKEGDPYLLDLNRYDEKTVLGSDTGHPYICWSETRRFVFLRA